MKSPSFCDGTERHPPTSPAQPTQAHRQPLQIRRWRCSLVAVQAGTSLPGAFQASETEAEDKVAEDNSAVAGAHQRLLEVVHLRRRR